MNIYFSLYSAGSLSLQYALGHETAYYCLAFYNLMNSESLLVLLHASLLS